jgi:hypothetical protein
MAKTATEILQEKEAKLLRQKGGQLDSLRNIHTFQELEAFWQKEKSKGTNAFETDTDDSPLALYHHIVGALQLNNAVTHRMLELMIEKERQSVSVS